MTLANIPIKVITEKEVFNIIMYEEQDGKTTLHSNKNQFVLHIDEENFKFCDKKGLPYADIIAAGLKPFQVMERLVLGGGFTSVNIFIEDKEGVIWGK